MKYLFVGLICGLFLMNCQNKERVVTKEKFVHDSNNLHSSIKSSKVETSQSELLYFDNDNIPDKAEIKATNNNEYSSFSLLIHLSTLKKTIEIPVYNNSILYNNIYADYYLDEPIIKDKVIELRIDYADKMTVANVSGEKKDLSEKIKYRF